MIIKKGQAGDKMKLKEKVAVITGAAQGIGAALAVAYAKEGARVVIADVVDGRKTLDAIEQIGGDALYVETDVTDENTCNAMAKAAADRFGGIDILVNNAAMYGNLIKKPFFEISSQEWNRVMEVNTTGPFLCTKAVFPYMKKKGGKIINVASSVVFEGPPGFPHYVASKGAVMTFTRCMARELGEYNINVNTLAPGYTQSEGSKAIEEKKAIKSKSSEEVVMQKRCLKRTSMPEDMAGTAIFLSGEESNFITGQLILCDGGASFH